MIMKAAKLIIFLFAINSSHLWAKPMDERKNATALNEQFEEAEKFFKDENYKSALNLYIDLFKKDPSNYNVCFKLGQCYLKTNKGLDKAVYYLEKASCFTTSKYVEGSYKERKAPLLAYKELGTAYHRKYKFDLAIEAYNKFKKALAAARIRDNNLVNEINREIEICQNGKKLITAPVSAKIENMGINVNSPYPDYSPVFTADQTMMIFTSGRPGNVGGKTYNGGKYFEDIYVSTKESYGWSPAINIGPPINTVGNDASVGISADGQEILIYKDDMGDGNIYSTSLKGSEWTTPVKLNAHINSKSWEPSAFISADGKTLYFVSDRPGGYGGRDIYKSEKNQNNDWGRAINLGPSVNSKYDEDAPFLHPDGVTLYFSSNGHETMGGFDIFESTQQPDGSWSASKNIGYPINSPGDDVFYVVTPDKQIAYYTSLREGGYGEKDNYKITFTDRKESALALQKGTVLDNNGSPARNAKITITDNETGKVVGVYHPNEKTGKYLFILTPEKSHNILYEADSSLFYSENVYIPKEAAYNETNKSLTLPPIAPGSKVILNNLFFDFDKAELRPYSNTELNNLHEFLKSHPDLAVEIAGYTDSKGTDEYNNALSKARAEAVVNYLKQKGIDQKRLTAVGHGKADPVAPNKKADGSDDPDGRQLNRRVELKIIDVK